MEIKDKVFTNKILSDADNSRYFNVILKNSNRIELWKVPMIALYGGLLSMGFLTLVTILWFSNIHPRQLMSHIHSIPKLKGESSLELSKVIPYISGETKIYAATASTRNQDLILNLTLTKELPVKQGVNQRVSSRLLDTKGNLMDPKILGIWKAPIAKNSTDKSSVIKLLIPRSALENPNSQKIEVSTFENEKISFTFLVNLAALKEDSNSLKNLSQMTNKVLTKK
ncbi:MAG: hypothetical protein WCI18_00225 [Pseudomonadota bacterium]